MFTVKVHDGSQKNFSKIYHRKDELLQSNNQCLLVIKVKVAVIMLQYVSNLWAFIIYYCHLDF